jgi:hypothetical protein
MDELEASAVEPKNANLPLAQTLNGAGERKREAPHVYKTRHVAWSSAPP